MSPTSPRHPGAGAGAARHAASFKVHRDSHSIRKAASQPSLSSTNSSVSSSCNAAITSSGHRPAAAPAPPRQKQPRPQPPQPQQQQPVIIYTHSPKVIRTNPRDFMSIVQKLTGLDSPGPARGAHPAARVNAGPVPAAAAAAQDESSSSSSESCANAHAAGPPPYADSQLMPPPAAPLDAHFMAPDIPLFAPDGSELQQLCAPRGLYGQFTPVDAAAGLGPVMATTVNGAGSNGGAVFSPSMVEAMRTFQDYN